MFHFDPRLIAVFGVLFVALGLFNLVLGRNRMLQMRAGGQTLPWYRQMGILTGIEYILLGMVLLLNLGISSGFFPGSFAGLIVPLYTVVLILAAIVLVAMLLQGLRGNRQRSRTLASTRVASVDNQAREPEGEERSAEQRAESLQRRRERRQKAAAARRRQAGRT
ncbi:MAG: hypothetical protein H0U76_18100 [Ktedonobacteraceae bacterium]|nr:hypothetical protein [Ktedonobacteraceae bacterium]